jgi:hypothetical protein
MAAGIRFAVAWGFCPSPAELLALLDRELAMLWKLERAQPAR